MATFKTKHTQVLEVKASDLDRDVLDILEGIVELTPVDPTSGMWLIEMKTLLDTLDDNGLEDDYEDAFKEQWTAFVKRLDTLNTISPFKYVMILQDIDDAKEDKERINKRYCIVQHIDDDGSETLEDYNDEETCRKAFEAIRANGYHIPENADNPSDVITFDEFDKVVFTMDVELWDERGNHEGFETIDYIPIVLHSGKVILEYCVTAVFDDEPDANHTKWFSTHEDAQSYIESIPNANAAIGKRLTLTEATKLLGQGKEIVFIFDDGTESVWDGGEIDEVYADQPIAVYI